MPSMLGHAGEMEMGRRMIQVEKHGNKLKMLPIWRCICPNCECQFTFNYNDISPKNCRGDIYNVIYCPECACCIDETNWDI